MGRSEICNLTCISEAFDKSVFDGNTFLPNISEENVKHRYVYIDGDMICFFLTDDDISQYISNMGSNRTPYSIARGEENIYILTPQFNCI